MRVKNKKITDPTCEEINHYAFYFLQRMVLVLGTEKNIINILSRKSIKCDFLKVYNKDITYYNFFDRFITLDWTKEGFAFWHKQQVLLVLMLFMAFPYSTVLERYCKNLLLRTSKPSFNKEAVTKELINIKNSIL